MDLSIQAIATVVSAVIGFIGVIVGVGVRMLLSRMKNLDTLHTKLQDALNDHLVDVSKNYVTKVEFKEDLTEIKDGVSDIRRYLMGVDYRGTDRG